MSSLRRIKTNTPTSSAPDYKFNSMIRSQCRVHLRAYPIQISVLFSRFQITPSTWCLVCAYILWFIHSTHHAAIIETCDSLSSNMEHPGSCFSSWEPLSDIPSRSTSSIQISDSCAINRMNDINRMKKRVENKNLLNTTTQRHNIPVHAVLPWTFITVTHSKCSLH